MVNVASFVRQTPDQLLRNFLSELSIEVPAAPRQKSKQPRWRQTVVETITTADRVIQNRVHDMAERIMRMTDEVGETAIFGLGIHKQELDSLPGAHARAAWLFLNDPAAFGRAEDVRFTDEHRWGRLWSAFCHTGPARLHRDAEALEAFTEQVRAFFDSPRVKIEIFERARPDFDRDDRELVQFTVYTEGREEQILQFSSENELGSVGLRRVHEAAITYEPASRTIEVVARDVQNRESLAGIFNACLLKQETGTEPLRLRRYNLQSLLKRRDFPNDPADRIESVKVVMLRLMPVDTTTERLTIECGPKAGADMWAMMAHRFGPSDPLRGGWMVTQARLRICFHPAGESRRMKVLSVTITMPHGCDLKERDERQRLIGSKYLRRWDLLEDVDTDAQSRRDRPAAAAA